MKRAIMSGIVMLSIVVSWEFAVWSFSVPEYLLPAPHAVCYRLIEILPSLTYHVIATATESALGFLIATVCGFCLAILFSSSKTLEIALYPYAIALKSVPVIAIAPLLTVWFGNGMLPKVMVAAIICFFPIVVNSVRGLTSVDREKLDVFNSLAASSCQVFMKLRIPSSLPYVFASLRVSSTLAVIGAIVAEFAGADRGLGFFITISSHRLNTVDMFVGILLSSLLGIAAFYSVVFVERLVLSWDPATTSTIT